MRSLSSGKIDEVIKRYSSNVPDAQDVFVIKYDTFRQFFENECDLCHPEYRILDEQFNETKFSFSVDSDDNIRIDTREGFRFRGWLVAGYNSTTDPMCARIN